MEEIVCRHTPDSAAAFYRWPQGVEITYSVDVRLPSLDAAASERAVCSGMEAWAKHCGLKIRRVTDPRLARIVVRSDRIDGGGRILGETELPVTGRPDARHLMRIDNAERWTERMLRQCVIHEMGHGIGIEHSPAGVVAIMAPVLNTALDEPQPWDVQEARRRYGDPAPKADPAPSPEPTLTPTPASGSFLVETPGNYLVRTTLTAPDGTTVSGSFMAFLPAPGAYSSQVATTRR